jgi:hypothetical protein
LHDRGQNTKQELEEYGLGCTCGTSPIYHWWPQQLTVHRNPTFGTAADYIRGALNDRSKNIKQESEDDGRDRNRSPSPIISHRRPQQQLTAHRNPTFGPPANAALNDRSQNIKQEPEEYARDRTRSWSPTSYWRPQLTAHRSPRSRAAMNFLWSLCGGSRTFEEGREPQEPDEYASGCDRDRTLLSRPPNRNPIF